MLQESNSITGILNDCRNANILQEYFFLAHTPFSGLNDYSRISIETISLLVYNLVRSSSRSSLSINCLTLSLFSTSPSSTFLVYLEIAPDPPCIDASYSFIQCYASYHTNIMSPQISLTGDSGNNSHKVTLEPC